MEFRETIQADLDYMADNSVSRGVQKSCPEQLSYMYTLEDCGEILGIGGFRLINASTAWCWLDMSHSAGKNMIYGYRFLRDEIEKFLHKYNLRRLQAYVECDFPEAIRMVEHLGFKKESTMKNFVGDKDAYMYVKII
jgi:RimJ/RimL family protein N-acetyltransferase